MTDRLTDAGIQAVATELFALLRTGRQIAPISARIPNFSMEDAYRVSFGVRQLRERAGETVIGRKIGFTNRTIWPEYQVYEPIWGYVYDRTVHDLARVSESFPLASLAEPRLEPEIMFKFATTPRAGMGDEELMGCVEWVTHGFEIVQSLFPGWKFAAPDTVAAFGLHGALLVGPPHKVAGEAAAWSGKLAAFVIDLMQNAVFVDRGKAANVLDGPIQALKHFIALLARQSLHPPVAAGEIVTTGTLTRAMPVAAGETWSTKLAPAILPGARIHFD